jgi:hypothetical protein
MRGRMLQLYRQHLQVDGHLFLMLPLTCVENSKWIDYKMLLEMIEKG